MLTNSKRKRTPATDTKSDDINGNIVIISAESVSHEAVADISLVRNDEWWNCLACTFRNDFPETVAGLGPLQHSKLSARCKVCKTPRQALIRISRESTLTAKKNQPLNDLEKLGATIAGEWAASPIEFEGAHAEIKAIRNKTEHRLQGKVATSATVSAAASFRSEEQLQREEAWSAKNETAQTDLFMFSVSGNTGRISLLDPRSRCLLGVNFTVDVIREAGLLPGLDENMTSTDLKRGTSLFTEDDVKLASTIGEAAMTALRSHLSSMTKAMSPLRAPVLPREHIRRSLMTSTGAAGAPRFSLVADTDSSSSSDVESEDELDSGETRTSGRNACKRKVPQGNVDSMSPIPVIDPSSCVMAALAQPLARFVERWEAVRPLDRQRLVDQSLSLTEPWILSAPPPSAPTLPKKNLCFNRYLPRILPGTGSKGGVSGESDGASDHGVGGSQDVETCAAIEDLPNKAYGAKDSTSCCRWCNGPMPEVTVMPPCEAEGAVQHTASLNATITAATTVALAQAIKGACIKTRTATAALVYCGWACGQEAALRSGSSAAIRRQVCTSSTNCRVFLVFRSSSYRPFI
jgi:hypothetical protein